MQVAWSLPDQHRANRAIDWGGLLVQVRCPLLLLHGSPELGGALGHAEAAALATVVTDPEVVRLEGGGHALRHEQFDAYLAAVRGFLRRSVGGHHR